MSTLLMAFVAVGTTAAMSSHLGTFWLVSDLLFNGTLVVGGLLVTAFAVYLANDLRAFVARGTLTQPNSPHTISVMFIVMDIMLAGVGFVPVNVSKPIHNLCAAGMAVIEGREAEGSRLNRVPWREIIVFARVFGWISVFIRFLRVTDQSAGPAPARTP